VSDCINASSPLISRHSSLSLCTPSIQTSLIDITPESAVTSERISISAVSQNDQLIASESLALQMPMPPCDRVSDIRLSEESTANIASNNVCALATETRTEPLLGNCVDDISSQLVSCTKESAVAKDLHSHQIDSVGALSSMMDVRNRDYIFPSGPEINRICLEAGKSMFEVNSSHSKIEKPFTPLCVDSSSTTVCCLPDCVLPNVAVATDSSQNGLSAVGHMVSCFKSMTAMTKSQKTAHHKGQLCDFILFFSFSLYLTNL